MRWNTRPKAERPEYPKLVPIAGSLEEVRAMLPAIHREDPEADAVDGGVRGVYVRVHNAAGESAARSYGETRDFPLR
jgi:hypothetical protein